MRKISAHYIFPISSPPLKYGVLVLNDDNSIAELIDTGGIMEETAGVEFYNGIIFPGLVNAHCHLELSHMKDKVSHNTGLPSFIEHVKSFRNDATDEDVIQAMREADMKMLQNGIVAVGDISNSTKSIPVKCDSKIQYVTFLEVFGFDPEHASGILKSSLLLQSQFLSSPKNNRAIITPHAAYSASLALFKEIDRALEHERAILSVHNQETFSENEYFISQTGKLFDFFNTRGIVPPDWFPANHHAITQYYPMLQHTQKILLVHNTFTTEEDIRFVMEQPQVTYWVLCPKSNIYIENSIADINLISKYSGNIAIGTDSLASNTGLSVLEELKTIQQHFPKISLSNLLTWGTMNGARALGFDETLGSFEKGKRPGVNLVENINFDSFTFQKESKIKVLA